MPDRSFHRGAEASALTTTAATGGGGMKSVPSARDLSRTDEGLGRAGPPSESESGDSAADLPLNMLWAPDKGRGGKGEGGARTGALVSRAAWVRGRLFACVPAASFSRATNAIVRTQG